MIQRKLNTKAVSDKPGQPGIFLKMSSNRKQKKYPPQFFRHRLLRMSWKFTPEPLSLN